MSDTTYLVTGACGFTGSHACAILSERGLAYRATDVAGADTSVLPAGAAFVPSNLTQPDTLKPVVDGIDVILHPAAIFDWWAPRERLEAVNVHGMENLCEAAVAAGVRRLVSWSTSGVYGNQKFDKLPITEDYPKKPIEDYSITKHEQDKIAHRYNGRSGLTTSIIRPGIVYGPRAKYGAMQFFELYAALPVAIVPVNFYHHFGPVHARDVAGAGIFVSDKKAAEGQEFALVDCSDISIAGFIKEIARALNKPIIPIVLPPLLARHAGLAAADISEWLAKNVTKTRPLIERGPIQFFPVDLHISNRKIREIGYKFEYPTPERGIRETLDWMREQGMLDRSPIDLITETLNKKVS